MNKNVKVRIPLRPHINAKWVWRPVISTREGGDIYATQSEQKNKSDFFKKISLCSHSSIY